MGRQPLDEVIGIDETRLLGRGSGAVMWQRVPPVRDLLSPIIVCGNALAFQATQQTRYEPVQA